MYHASVTTPEGAVYQVTNRDGSSLSFETSDGQKNVKIVSDDKGQPGIFKNLADLMLLKEANK